MRIGLKIVIAPDHFKESLSALDVATAIEAGFREVYAHADYIKMPMADGGEGTVEALVAATRGRIVPVVATGPLGQPVDAFYGLTGNGRIAVIEMAAASGLTLISQADRDPWHTTSYGTGELIATALEAGARHFIIGIGGSATNDGGAGMIQALGGRFLDARNKELDPGGGALADLARIDVSGLDKRLQDCLFDVACDVDNPLAGPHGASMMFGTQKGATPEMLVSLDNNLAHYAAQIRLDLGRSVADVPGAGAAGGMGAAFLAFFDAHLRPGIEIVTEALGLDRIISDADLVITGEGRIDGQTAHGKTPVGVARIAKRHGKPVIGIAGSLTNEASGVHARGIDAIFSVLSRPCTTEEAFAAAAANTRMAARNIAAAIRLGEELNARKPRY